MKKIIIFMCMFLLLSISVFAFGVSSPYYSDNPLVLSPGESKDVAFSLQNMAGATQDLNVELEVITGQDLVTVLEQPQMYYVPANSEDVKSNIRVTVPSTAVPGDNFNIVLNFKSLNSGEGGMVDLGLGTRISFGVVVAAPPQEPEVQIPETVPEAEGNNNLIYYIVIIVIILILLLIVFAKKKGKEKKDKK
ncbi:MAG: hypothetical protein V1663_05565 [archaeon]